MKPIDVSKIRTILVTRIDRIGDVVLSTPVFQALRHSFPHARIYGLVSPSTKDVLEGNPFIDRIFVYDKVHKQRSVWKTFLYAWMLRKEHIDVVVHLHATNRVYMLAWFAGIPIRIGYQRKIKWMLTHSLPETKREGKKHESEYNFDMLSFLSVPPPDAYKLTFVVPDSARKEVRECVPELQQQGRYVALFPSASCPSRRWPPDRFCTLAETLRTRYKVSIILVGGGAPEDYRIAGTIMENVSFPIINMTGKLSLKGLGALLERVQLLISNDSGPVHIAASLHVPVISLFSRTNPGLSPVRWKPLGDKSFYVHKPVGCTECLAHNCTKGFLCLAAISVEDIVGIIEANHLL